MEDLKMSRQSQWLFEAPLVLGSDRYTNQEYYSDSEWEAEGKTIGQQQGPSSQSKRITLAMRPKPYLNLDLFIFNKALLTDRLRKMVDNFANTVVLSWNSTQPIEVIRLIGHTDNTGTEKYNVGLGAQRAKAVEALLRDKLKGLSGRTRIVVEPSPGESEPTVDNRTKEGRERNRRVEVFITTGVVTPAPPTTKPKKPVDLRLPKDWQPPDLIVRTKPDSYKFGQPIPSVPQGKSFKEWFDRKMAELGVPKWLRNQIWDAIFNKDWGLLRNLLITAGFSSGSIEPIIETIRAASNVKAR
jgi:outer membrane protein OmpA-like peptidoglycan-associated protein